VLFSVKTVDPTGYILEGFINHTNIIWNRISEITALLIWKGSDHPRRCRGQFTGKISEGISKHAANRINDELTDRVSGDILLKSIVNIMKSFVEYKPGKYKFKIGIDQSDFSNPEMCSITLKRTEYLTAFCMTLSLMMTAASDCSMNIRIFADRTLHSFYTSFAVNTAAEICDGTVTDTEKLTELFKGRELPLAVYTSFSDIAKFGMKLNIVTENGVKKLVCRIGTDYMLSNILLIRSEGIDQLAFSDDYDKDNEIKS